MASSTRYKSRKSAKNSNRIHAVNEINLDAKNPIPFATEGFRFSADNDTEYIPFLGNQANFGQKLLEARLLSTTHSACVTTKSSLIAGTGFEDRTGKEIDKKITDWLSLLNLKGQNSTDINKDIQEYFLTFGNVPIELVKLTVGKEKKLFIYVHNFLECRLAVPNKDDICTKVLISKKFNDGDVFIEKVKEARELPIYNSLNSEAENWIKDGNAERTMIWYSNPISGVDYYGLPSSIASLVYQILEYKGARYNLDNLDNNMVIDAMMFLKGNLSQEEANRIGRGVRMSHTGDGKRGRVAVFSSEEGIDDVILKSLDTHKDGSYTDADNKWSDKIILANEWDAVLAGIVAPSSFGKGSGFITKIIEWKMKSVIQPAQSEMMEKVWKTIFEIAKKWIGLPFDKYDLQIKNSIDISGLTDVDITPAVQVNEVRQAKGLPVDERMVGVYLKETVKSVDNSNVQD